MPWSAATTATDTGRCRNRPRPPAQILGRMTATPTGTDDRASELPRGLGFWQAVSLNVANMVGIGPFITIPAFIAAMGGPHALIAWVIAAVLVICDGLVWSELGAALPGSGGTYHFLREIFGRYRWGRLLPFLFIWQFLVSGALEMASGYIGGLQYLEYAVPQLRELIPPRFGGTKWIAAAAAVLVAALPLPGHPPPRLAEHRAVRRHDRHRADGDRRRPGQLRQLAR